jgi:hypothetical protein
MKAEYKFRYNELFVAESFERYRQHHPMRLLRWALKGLGFIGLGSLAALGVIADSAPLTGMFSFFIVLLVSGPAFDMWWAKRRLRRSPFYNTDVIVRLSDAGYFGEDANSRTELSWAVFTDGSRLPDGFLLFTGPQQFHWFPDRALVAGEIPEIESVLKQKLSKFRAAEQSVAADRPKMGSG